jgi:hypothetical protein
MIRLRLAGAVLVAAALAGCFTYFVTSPPRLETGQRLAPTAPALAGSAADTPAIIGQRRSAEDYLLYDDAGHRMIPTHATKAGIRYRYYISLPHLKGESKTVSAGSVARIPATDIEDVIVKSVNEHLVAQHDQPSSSSAHANDRGVMIAEQVVRIDVHKDRLIVRLKSAGTEEGSHSTDGQLLSIPWQKPPITGPR